MSWIPMDWLLSISEILQSSRWIALLAAVLAGVLTSVAPCCLSSVTLVMGYIGSADMKPRQAFLLSLTFASGSAITFTVLGTVASLAGNLLNGTGKWWFLVLGIILILMALQIWGIVQIIPTGFLLSKVTQKNYFGALLAGMICGCFSTPCATPVLVTLLALVAGRGRVMWGVILLMLYSLGHGVLTVAAGTCTGLVQQLVTNSTYGRFSKWLKLGMGTIIFLMALYMLYRGF